MSHGKFAWVMTVIYGVPWIWTVLAVILCGVTLGLTVDIAWGLGCIFLVFLIIPLAMTYLYYSYALCTPTFMNVIPHCFSFGDGYVSVKVYEGDKGGEKEENRNEVAVHIYTLDVRCEELGRKYIFPDGIAIKVVNPGAGFLWFSPDVFEDLESFRSAIDGISSGSRC